MILNLQYSEHDVRNTVTRVVGRISLCHYCVCNGISKRDCEMENIPISTIGWTVQIVITYQLVNTLHFPHDTLLLQFQYV